MTKHLAIFQIGPVQDFINCAKKTQDYLAGSLILSYLTGLAMARVESGVTNGEIVYPFHVNNRICEEAKKALSGQNPDLQGAPLYGTVPNRFVAAFESDTESIKRVLAQAEEDVEKEYENILKAGKAALEHEMSDLTSDSFWNQLWNQYLRPCDSYPKHHFEVYWVVSPYENNSYLEDYRKAELLLGARKGVRDFVQVEETGTKCTLCGHRRQLSWDSKDTGEFWQMVRSLDLFKFLFREGERLCVPCTAKRLASKEYFNLKDIFFPSTSTMAVSSTFLDLAELHTKPEVTEAIEEFQDSFQRMRLKQFPTNLTPLNLVQTSLGKLVKDVFRYDGDALILDTYQPAKIHKEYGSFYRKDELVFTEAVEKTRELLKRLLDIAGLKEAAKYKYYAVVAIDGDDMGKWLDGSKTDGRMDLNLHKEISRRLSGYASQEVPDYSERRYLAKIVYFGGDEGVILCSLKDLLPMMLDLHTAYLQTFKGVSSHPGTNSMGAVIAHHQQNLLQVMAEARNALHEAKQVRLVAEQKDAFCVSLMKRSGGTIQISGKFPMLEHLQKMICYYQEEKISSRWVYALDTICPTFQDVVDFRLQESMLTEIKRILRRHIKAQVNSSEKKAILGELIPEIKDIVRMLQSLQAGNVMKNNLRDLVNLEHLAVYIAKGGGR